MHGAGRYALQCLTNLDQFPPTGTMLITPPLKIQKGSGSPPRTLLHSLRSPIGTTRKSARARITSAYWVRFPQARLTGPCQFDIL
jgi:hypothetical protein